MINPIGNPTDKNKLICTCIPVSAVDLKSSGYVPNTHASWRFPLEVAEKRAAAVFNANASSMVSAAQVYEIVFLFFSQFLNMKKKKYFESKGSLRYWGNIEIG